MSGLGIRASGVALGIIALVTGCTSGGSSHPPDTAVTARITSDAPPPVGSVEHPRPVECVEGINQTAAAATGTTAGGKRTGGHTKTSGNTASTTHPATASTSPSSSGTSTTPPATTPAAVDSDVTVGPLTWPGLRALADGDQNGYGYRDSDGWHYKVGAQLRAVATVTLTIGAEQRAKAGLQYGRAFGSTPAPAITFNSCPAKPTVFTGFFFVAGDGRACVPVDVRVGEDAPRRVVISFFNGQCPAA
jgi:hypothetical protein